MSNYGFDERDTTTATTRETMYQPQQPLPPQQSQPAPGYGYGQPPAWGQRAPYGYRRGPGLRGLIETKPFFLTSEFVISLLASIGIALSAATMRAFGGWRAWVLITAIVVSYNISRGIAKAGRGSRAHDPREDVDLSFGQHDHAHDHAHDRV
jgi:hypothetical protein